MHDLVRSAILGTLTLIFLILGAHTLNETDTVKVENTLQIEEEVSVNGTVTEKNIETIKNINRKRS